MICPNCKSDRLGWSSDFTYDECGYDGSGTVHFYECDLCGATVEICVPDNQKTDGEKSDAPNG